MKVVVFGATGMVGQGVVRECLLDARVDSVLSVGRSPSGVRDPKFSEVVHENLLDVSSIESELAGFDACFFCLGVSAAGKSEADYRRITYDMTTSVAAAVARQNPHTTFVYVSGQGTDSSERGRFMWARVKGQTENALLAMPLDAYAFRPGFIQPMHGVTSKTTSYRLLYRVAAPLYPVLKTLFPKYVTTSENVGRAMIEVAGGGVSGRVLENRDINALAERAAR
jgi:uncharacterized protein YbjT (DUF2867 family)